MTLAAQIRRRIARKPKGYPFTSKEFLSLGSRAAVDQALSRMAKAGEVARVTRGVFVVPQQSQYVGMVPPTPEKVAAAMGAAAGETIAPHGAEAVRRLGLSTQTPMRPVFYTNGPSRRFQIGKLVVAIKHVSPRKLAFAGKPEGEVLSALWYLGKENVTPEIIERVRARVSEATFKKLCSARQVMPGWMSNAFTRFEKIRLS
jgi:hypothetical protein